MPSQSNFVSLLDLFQKDYQTAVHRAILDSFARSEGQTSDPIIINTAFSSAKSARSLAALLLIIEGLFFCSSFFFSF